MQTATYKIEEQLGQYGFFAIIEFRFVMTNEFKKIDIVCDGQFTRWKPGILFGANYFLEHILERIGLEIEIIDIKYNDVDTNNTVIAFVVFKALVDATKIAVVRSIVFDKDNKSFMFPK
jgi:hypothetical protein